MTSSDATAVDPDVVAALAGRVGRSIDLDVAGATRLGIVCGWFNGGITARLLEGALDALDVHGGQTRTSTVAWVPGAFELPLAAQVLAERRQIDAVVALGAVIRGETPHFELVAEACAQGLGRVGLETGKPVIFGVLTTNTVEQALARSEPGPTNKGFEAVVSALQMVSLLGAIRSAQPAREHGPGAG
jgi:6,7-dimethyl-8-ribityllumazine synthase